MLTQEEAVERLRQAGLSVTAPRIALLCLLSESPRPLSCTEANSALAEQGSNPATVFRNLKRLADKGLVRVASRDGVDRFELRGVELAHPHPHFVCRDCGRVTCLPEAEVKAAVPSTAWKTSLSLAELQFVGRCPSCTNEETPAE